MVAYPAAMSSGETATEPRPRAGTYVPWTSSGVATPRLFAIAATRAGVTSSVSCAYTVLSDRSVARSIDVQPTYVESYVLTHHHEPSSQLPFGTGRYVNGADT